MEAHPHAGLRSRGSWILTVLLLVTTGTLLPGCARQPDGPAFSWAPPPAGERARVYVYRIDPRESLATVAVRIGGRDLGRLASGEYQTLELPPGPHRLRVGMRGLALTAWGWNTHEFHLRPGDTLFLKLAVRLEEVGNAPGGTPSGAEIGGRAESHAQQNVFIAQPSRAEATRELETTKRVTHAGGD